MIWVFNSHHKRLGPYKTYEEVCDYFRRLEYLSPLFEEDSCNEERWDFVYWSHRRLSFLYEHLNDNNLTYAERAAYENELDLVEIFDGSLKIVEQYIVTPDLNLPSLRRDWCFDYAYAHGFRLLEMLPGGILLSKNSLNTAISPRDYPNSQLRLREFSETGF